MKLAKLAAAALTLAATPALANDNVVAGATVTGPEGNPVGTIESVSGGVAILDTGKHKVPLGVDMYGSGENGLTITVTKAQLDGMMDEQLAAAAAQRDAALVTGATVVSADAQPAGSVLSIDDALDAIIVQRDAGVITLKREHFAVNGEGALMALFNLAQIDANTVEVPEGVEIVTSSEADAVAEAAAS